MKTSPKSRTPAGRPASTNPTEASSQQVGQVQSISDGRGSQVELEELQRQLKAAEEEAAHYKAEWKATRLEADELHGDVREYRDTLLEARERIKEFRQQVPQLEAERDTLAEAMVGECSRCGAEIDLSDAVRWADGTIAVGTDGESLSRSGRLSMSDLDILLDEMAGWYQAREVA
ncbi:MAG: hypothetical protein ACE5JP_13355 [Candidatus Bipolaricaulia bacterium]